MTAALELCAEVGYFALRIEAIARRAGTGKQTIYRWWPSKGVLLLDALQDAARDSAGFADTGNIWADLQHQMEKLVGGLYSSRLGPVLLALIDGAHHDPLLAERLMSDVIGPRRATGLARLQAAVERGELPVDTDLPLLLDQLYGPLYYRFLVTRELTDVDFVRRHLAALMRNTTTPVQQDELA